MEDKGGAMTGIKLGRVLSDVLGTEDVLVGKSHEESLKKVCQICI